MGAALCRSRRWRSRHRGAGLGEDLLDLLVQELHAFLERRAVLAQVDVHNIAQLATDRAGPLLRVLAPLFHHQDDHRLNALLVQRVVELELAVVVGARVTLARRLIDVALGDEDAHGLGIVDSLCHLPVDIPAHFLLVKPRGYAHGLEAEVHVLHPRVVAAPELVVRPVVCQEDLCPRLLSNKDRVMAALRVVGREVRSPVCSILLVHHFRLVLGARARELRYRWLPVGWIRVLFHDL
mmetsp:Transcript_21864/g.50463  ORF Transcript_21864/g.50463 Transcript_21864/m.50463 type:complete len:238 (+) Transcript_21864:506-1219(+)